MNKCNKQTCPYCGIEYKRLTTNHIKTHNVTWEQYLKEFKEVSYLDRVIENFLNDFYITKRSKYLIYNYGEKNPITIYAKDKSDKLHMGVLKKHRSHTKTLGIFFPEVGSNLIGLDLDSLDKELLNRIYIKVTEYVQPTSILISFSGGKGYHIDVFLEEIVPRDLIKKFHKIILEELNINENVLELRGANNQGYKLPFGIHQGTQKYCYACTEFGMEIKDTDVETIIKSRTKTNIKELEEAVQEYWEIQGDINNGPLTTSDILEFEEIKESVKILPNYSNLNKDFIEDLSRVYRNGFVGQGVRSKYTLKIALFLKCHLCCNKDETLQEMLQWYRKCKGYSASKKEFENDIINTVNRVFKEDLKLNIAAREIKISKIEIKEILSVKTKNKLQTKAVRQLYYMFLLQSKAYADDTGVFYFTYVQMEQMGAVKRRPELMKQIEILINLNKIYKYQTKRQSRYRFAPTEYKLVLLSEVAVDKSERTFLLCPSMSECINCIECATCYLVRNTKELKSFYTGRKKECPYNKL